MARKKAPSPAQQRQRELAWLLYITEGYAANVQHALAVNAYTLDSRALALMDRIFTAAAITTDEVRALLQEEQG